MKKKIPFSYIYWPVNLRDPNTGELVQDAHITAKFLGNPKNPPSVSKVEILIANFHKTIPLQEMMFHPTIFDTPFGEKFVLEIEPNETMWRIHGCFDSLREDDFPTFRPHITLPEDIWKRVVKSKLDRHHLRLCAGSLVYRRKGVNFIL